MVLKCYEFKIRCKKTREALILYNKTITQDIVRDLNDKTTVIKNQNTTQVELDEKDTLDFTDFNDNSNEPELTQECDKPELINVIKIELFDQLTENINKVPLLTCEHCSESFLKRNDLSKHMKTIHKDKTLVCDVCNQSFTQIQTLKRHSKIHQSDQKNKLCPFCGKCFVRTDDLRRHVRIHTNER